MNDKGYTATHRRILELLSDGKPHTRKEIHALLWDPLSKLAAIKGHISLLRKLLPPGQAIICELIGYSINYRHVNLLNCSSQDLESCQG